MFEKFKDRQLARKKDKELNEKIKTADRLHKINGRQYRVIKWVDGSYIVVDNNWRKNLNKDCKKCKLPQLSYQALLEATLYVTSTDSITRKELKK